MLLSVLLQVIVALLPARSWPPLSAQAAAVVSSPSQAATAHAVLAAEYSRGTQPEVLRAAMASGDTLLQRLAVRAYGRWERAEYAEVVRGVLSAPSPAVRREAVNALAQMRVTFDGGVLLRSERDGSVRSAIYEAIGRTPVPAAGDAPAALSSVTDALIGGLSDSDAAARAGAARGLEALIRRTARTSRPTASTITALREALLQSYQAPRAGTRATASQLIETRQLLLLALTAAGDRDSSTFTVALRDTSAQVRRLAVAASRQWVDDPSPMVRYQALRVAGTCERAIAALRDTSAHAQLVAVDLLGERRCEAAIADSLVRRATDWRVRAHALVALARIDSVRARAALPVLISSPVWQARAWTATAAAMLKDSATLARLARDTAPNVAVAALTTTDDALRALTSEHAGLALAGANKLKGHARLGDYAPQLATALLRLSARGHASLRDPRVAILQRLLEAADSATALRVRGLTRDADPEVAALAARVMTERAHIATTATTTRYEPPPFPSQSTLQALRGAQAVLTVRGLGEIHIDLLPDEAPATVAMFADLVERQAFNGLTWHRIVPNFVLQGGSPGADEYDALTTTFMRDEVGYARHARGTFGISTRGRDTGDGQLFINLVDNFRLDHDYTVFAAMRRGFDVMDRVQEGDVIESVRIVRASAGRGAGAGISEAGAAGAGGNDSSRALSSAVDVLSGARSPAYARDGRLALTINGHILLQKSPGAPLTALTSGAGWDRDPAWTPDGTAIVFASDRSGNYDLWRVVVNADGSAGALTQLTRTSEPETSPSIASDGRVAFLRGSGNASRVWIMNGDGTPTRVTSSADTERAPRFTPNGTMLAFLTVSEAGRRLHVWSMAPGAATSQRWSQTVDASAEHLSWAWDGERLAVSTRTGTQIVPRLGGYTNFAATARGHSAWAPDDRTIAIASFDEPSVAYNGDPDRGSDRSAVLRPNAASTDRMSFVVAPVAPNVATTAAPPAAPVVGTRAEQNATAFDRLWERSARLYFSGADATQRRAQWDRVRATLRPRAIAATSDSALDVVLHEALQQRPTLREPARGRAAVSSAHPVSTNAGLEILRRGGNVVDAAVAVSFALGVVEPDASGIAGYGEMVIALKSLPKPTLIEFMSRVPEDAGLSNTSLLVNGRYPSDGPVLVNVPGTVSGMYTAWQKYGSKKVPWADLIAPAIRAATEGYVVSDGLATTLATEREHFAKYEGSRALFFRNGEPLRAGDTLKNPDLAWVLGKIAANGADGFYKGEVAAKWVADLRAKGNAMKLSDLARYFAPEREPVSGTYRGYTIYSGAPPVSGGAELVARLNLLEQVASPRSYRDDAASMHAALTAWFLVPSSRGRIADPALWPIDVSPITDKDTARARWACYSADRALTPESVRGDSLPCLKAAAATAPRLGGARASGSGGASSDDAGAANGEVHASPCGEDHAAEMTVCHAAGTTAFTVADNDGNMVAVTQTLGTWGGNFYVTPGLGFLSNDKLTSYGTDPAQYGSRLPFARHGSTIAPTVAYKKGKPFAAVGAAGNAWITSAVYQTLLGMLDYDLSPQQALELPRFLPGGGFGGPPATGAGPRAPVPYTLQLEDGFAPWVTARLQALGYNLSFISLRGELREGYGAAVRVDGKVVTAGADPRRAGAAGAITP